MSELATQIAVLETQMKNIAKQVDSGFVEVQKQLENNSREHKEMFTAFEKAIEEKADKKEVDTLMENQRWIVKLILGIVITAVIGLVIKTNI
jgi:hypothetical protein